MDKQPDVLILASLLEESDRHWNKGIAQELRRLHSENQELVKALNAAANYIDTLGGVSESYRQKLAKHKEQA